jgi:hypothetical protein
METVTEKDFDGAPTDEIADWIASYGNASLSPYVRARLRAAAKRLRELAKYDNPGFGGK